jgi:hypothetical protein
MLYRSEEDPQKNDPQLNDGETKLSLSRDLSPKLTPNSQEESSLDKDLKIKPEWLKGLAKVFTLLDSKAIKKLLLLLEHPKETTRKMIMVLFQIILLKTENKIHFVEKCAIGFSPGVYLISRMKFVYSVSKDPVAVFRCLSQIKKHFRTIRMRLELEDKKLKGTFDLP